MRLIWGNDFLMGKASLSNIRWQSIKNKDWENNYMLQKKKSKLKLKDQMKKKEGHR